MTRYLLSRLAQSVLAFFCILTITFFLSRLAPGSPFNEEKEIPEHILEKTRAYYGMDKSWIVQYFKTFENIFKGDLGLSFGNKGYTVNEVIAQGLPVSIIVGLGGLAIALCIGIPIGILAAARKNSLLDYIPMSTAMFGICLPTFVVAPLLAIFFGLKLRWFSATGWDRPSDWFLPALTLGLYYAAYVTRLTRSGMLEILNQDFIRTARSKGLSEKWILFRHSLRGGLVPVVSFIGPALAGLISGSFVVETIFHLPGLGQHFIKAASNRDYPLILGTVAVYAALILIVNFLADIIQAWMNPRQRLTDS